MKRKVSELEGALLDAAVAKAQGMDFTKPDTYLDMGQDCVFVHGVKFYPSRLWAHGGPIIQRERLVLSPYVGGAWVSMTAVEDGAANYQPPAEGLGPTPLTAAMRAYVVSKLGKEVELP